MMVHEIIKRVEEAALRLDLAYDRANLEIRDEQNPSMKAKLRNVADHILDARTHLKKAEYKLESV